MVAKGAGFAAISSSYREGGDSDDDEAEEAHEAADGEEGRYSSESE